MALAGAIAGKLLVAHISTWDHWLALALLSLIGVRMIYGSFQEADEQRSAADLTRGLALLGLSVAVSIDALAAGVGLAAAHAALGFAVFVIGATAALATALAMLLARQIGARVGRRCEALAGLVLIALGLRIVLAHEGWL